MSGNDFLESTNKSASGDSSAIWALARILYERMERLNPPVDPSKPVISWGGLSERQREYYRLSVEALLEQDDLVRSGLALLSYDHEVVGSSHR